MDFLPLFLSVFLASLLGSLHCVGMCGPIVVLTVGGGVKRSSWGPMASYHLGRIVAYAGLGVVAGGIGSGIHNLSYLAGIQRGATQIAGAAMIISGALALIQFATGKTHRTSLPARIQHAFASLHQFARSQSRIKRSALVGMLTAILPCGWLYSFLLAAMATASPKLGAGVMLVFALGGLPALTIAGLTGVQLRSHLGKLAPVMVAILVLLTGVSLVAMPRSDHAIGHGTTMHLVSVQGKLPPLPSNECAPPNSFEE